MSRSVKHFSLHRIASTELRVVSDVEDGVLPVIQVEESIIQGYNRTSRWPHRNVTLFILEDLQPLVRQFHQGNWPAGSSLSTTNFSSADLAASSGWPVVNIYDLNDLANLTIFANYQEMVAQNYWKDPIALKGLFAHEHAHPLAENQTTHSSRQAKFEIIDDGSQMEGIGNRKSNIIKILTALAGKLSLLAPREVFANLVTIQSGFGDALLYLNSRNMENARRSISDRKSLVSRLKQEIALKELTPEGVDLLLLVGDLNGLLPLAMEVAPFYRAGREKDARFLEGILETSVFPYIDPAAVHAFTTLKDMYFTLPDDSTLPIMKTWLGETLDVLFEIVADKGLALPHRLWLTEK